MKIRSMAQNVQLISKIMKKSTFAIVAFWCYLTSHKATSRCSFSMLLTLSLNNLNIYIYIYIYIIIIIIIIIIYYYHST